jgi:DNA polymerase
MDLPEGFEDEVVKIYRESHPEIVKLWRKMEQAARTAILNPGAEYPVNQMSFRVMEIANGTTFLLLKLPSGREISYPLPELVKCLSYTYKDKRVQIMEPNVEDIEKAEQRVGKKKLFIKDVVTYYGKTGKDGMRAWGRVATYGAKFTENSCQGLAADFMVNGALNCEAAGYEIATLIHDEALNYKKPGQTSDELCRLLASTPEWAEGMPLLAEGKTVPFYTK